MIVHAIIISETKNFNNVLHYKYFVIVIIFDRCFKASLMLEKDEKQLNRITVELLFKVHRVFHSFFPSALMKNMFYNTVIQAIMFYIEWLQISCFPKKVTDKASMCWIEWFILNKLRLYLLWDYFLNVCVCYSIYMWF